MNRRMFVKLGGGLALVPELLPQTLHGLERTVSPETSVHEPARDLSVVARADVVVCGAGPAGVAAAVSAARKGAKTLLL